MKPRAGDIWQYQHSGHTATLLLLEKTYPEGYDDNRFFSRILWQSHRGWWQELDHWSVDDSYGAWRKIA